MASVPVRIAGRALAAVSDVHLEPARAAHAPAMMIAPAPTVLQEEVALARAMIAVAVWARTVSMASALDLTATDAKVGTAMTDAVLETAVKAVRVRTVIPAWATVLGLFAVPVPEPTAFAPMDTVAARAHTARHVSASDAVARACCLFSVTAARPAAVVVLALRVVA